MVGFSLQETRNKHSSQQRGAVTGHFEKRESKTEKRESKTEKRGGKMKKHTGQNEKTGSTQFLKGIVFILLFYLLSGPRPVFKKRKNLSRYPHAVSIVPGFNRTSMCAFCLFCKILVSSNLLSFFLVD